MAPHHGHPRGCTQSPLANGIRTPPGPHGERSRTVRRSNPQPLAVRAARMRLMWASAGRAHALRPARNARLALPGYHSLAYFDAKFPRRFTTLMIPRYSRPEMTAIWEPENKFRIWFEIEAHACDAQAELGVIPKSAAEKVW